MRRTTALLTLAGVLLFCLNSRADRHLELGFQVMPNMVFDDSFEFFSDDNNAIDCYGFDLRYEVVEIKKTLHLLPFAGYRFGRETGSPAMYRERMETIIRMHDLFGGLRMKGWLLPWLGAFGQAFGGVVWLDMKGKLKDEGNSGMYDTYRAQKTKWSIGAGFGVEFRRDPSYLERRGIDKFNFGGELSVGFIRRATTKFEPQLKGGDELSIQDVDTVNFGDIDLTGFNFQAGITFSFL